VVSPAAPKSFGPPYNSYPPVSWVIGVLYQINVSILVGTDLAYFLLVQSSPPGHFVLDPSASTTRFARNNFLNELAHIGNSWWTKEYDAGGNPASTSADPAGVRPADPGALQGAAHRHGGRCRPGERLRSDAA
jgi:hypothetical protein